MQAFFDPEDGNPKVKISIRGDRRKKVTTVTALLDTGHTGSLALPVLTLMDIGATLDGFGPLGLADGSQIYVYYFRIYVEVDGVEKQIQASMINDPEIREAIAGLELLGDHVALIDFKNKRISLMEEEKLRKITEEKEENNE
jgi:predicted aspartyl protease